MSFGRFLIPLFLSACACAQVTAPPQPKSGPGSSAYPFGFTQTGPYNAKGGTGIDSYSYYIYTPTALAPGPNNPNPRPAPTSAPAVLFIHGYDGDTLDPYLLWMEHMAKMGSTVVWVLYDAVPVASWDATVITDWEAALALLEAPTPGLIPPTKTPAGKPMTFFVGHSSGAYMALKVASEAPASGFPPPLGIVAIEPGEGQIPTFDPSLIDSHTAILMAVGDIDKSARLCTGATIWSQMTQIPASQKPFLTVRTDDYGTPNQLANHWFPLTDTTKDDVPPPVSVDNRDYNITYKFSVAMIRCIHDATYCDYVYGTGPVNNYGATTQTDMGVWSDGTPVVPMLEIANPPGYYGTCKGL